MFSKFIFTVLNGIGETLLQVLKICFGITLLLIICSILRMIIDAIRGKNEHKIFKKRNIIGSDISILATELSKIKGYSKIYKTDNYLIYINEYSIDLVLFCDYYGMITGQQEDDYWFFNSDLDKQKVDNPIMLLEKMKQNLIGIIGKQKIRAYILLGSNTRLNMKVTNTEIIRRKNAYYVLSKRNEKKIYTPKQIDEMYEKINV